MATFSGTESQTFNLSSTCNVLSEGYIASLQIQIPC